MCFRVENVRRSTQTTVSCLMRTLQEIVLPGILRNEWNLLISQLKAFLVICKHTKKST